MARPQWQQVLPELFSFADACNVYLLRYGDRGIAVDFGSGAWQARLGEIGVAHLEHVVLTHAHRDQLYGLYRCPDRSFTVHAPAADAQFLQPAALSHFWQTYQANGCPACYNAPRYPLSGVRFDLAADTETVLGPARFCAIATPGHTPGALSYLVNWNSRHLAFCGDAAHAGGKLHQPYHLEWDHWTANGCLNAWQGLERLHACHFDFLLPAHGPQISQYPRVCVDHLRKRLLALVRAKGSVCAGEPARWLDLKPLACGASQLLPHLYHFGANSFLLVSAAGEGLVVDPQQADLDRLTPLMEAIGLERIGVGTASHYHLDHSDGLNRLRRQYGAQIWLHPWVAEPIADRDRYDLPWLPAESVQADCLLPEKGPFSWHEYRFASHPFPGQTRWHTAFDTWVDGRHVLFSGDNYQPPTRWNGTGGFCSYNQSRFPDGFAHSARTVLEIEPEIICNGHGCVYRFASSHYRRILKWAEKSEKALQALCPSTAYLADYDCRSARWEPFVKRARPGQALDLSLVYHNHGEAAIRLVAKIVPPAAWSASPAKRQTGVRGGEQRGLKFTVEVPPQADKGRYLLSADLQLDDQLYGEACVALIDVS